jgi:hypothetical protein
MKTIDSKLYILKIITYRTATAFFDSNQDLSRVTQSSMSDLGGNFGLKNDLPVEMPNVPSLNETRICMTNSDLLELS